MAVHALTLTGLRFETASAEMPLSMASPGQTATIKEVRGGRNLRKRLRDLGLNPGSQVRVVKNDASGPMIVAATDDSRLALGRGMAHHILVSCSTPLL